MKFYTFPPSGHAARVKILLEELQIQYEEIVVNLAGERTSEFLALNPNGKVPAIDDGGFTLYESHAIMRYLCAKEDATEWYPHEPKARAMVDQWLEWNQTRLNVDAVTINFNSIVLGEHGDKKKVAEAKANLKNILPILDAALSDKDYLCGNISIADLSIFTSIVYLKNNGVSLEDYENLSLWFNTLQQRESVIKVAL